MIWVGTIVVSIPFIFVGFGATQFTGGAADEVVGTILREPVMRSELEEVYSRWYGGRAPQDLDRMKEAFDRLAYLRAAKHYGVAVSEEEIDRMVDQYDLQRQVYAQYRLQPPEERMRHLFRLMGQYGKKHPEVRRLVRDMAIEGKFYELVDAGTAISDLESFLQFSREKEQRKAIFVPLRPEDFEVLVTPQEMTEKDQQEFYEKHKDEYPGEYKPGYMLPPKIRIEYLLADRDRIRSEMDVTEDEIAKFYAENRTRWEIEEAASEEGKHTPLEEVADEIREELLDSKTDERIALVMREAPKFMDPDFSRPLEMPAIPERIPELAYGKTDFFTKEEAKDLPLLGDLSTVLDRMLQVRTMQMDRTQIPKGGMIYQVVEKIPARSRPYEEVKEQVAEDLEYHLARDKAFEQAQRMRTILKNSTWDDAIAKINELLVAKMRPPEDIPPEEYIPPEGPVKWYETPFFTKDVPSLENVGSVPAFKEEIFKLKVRKENDSRDAALDPDIGEVVRDPKTGTCFVIQLTEVKQPDMRGFVARLEELREKVKERKRRDLRFAWQHSLLNEQTVTFGKPKE